MIEKNLRNIIRPTWIELLKLTGVREMDAAARCLFRVLETKERRRRQDDGYKVDHTEYNSYFGIDITQYSGFYAEIGSTETTEPPCFPTDRVYPVLAIKQDDSGNFNVATLTLPGFFHNSLERAWVNVDDYEAALGDTYFEELEAKSEEVKKAAISAVENGSNN